MSRTPDLHAFRASLAGPVPLPSLPAPLAALWWDAKGDWTQAHACVQDENGPEAAWVHAYLHRKEGDLGNAGYWYRRAGRPAATGALEDEWAAIAGDLLAMLTPPRS